jgi:hypothetical protein
MSQDPESKSNRDKLGGGVNQPELDSAQKSAQKNAIYL